MLEIFDAHFHIVEDYHRVVENQGYRPKTFRVSDYLSWFYGVRLVGGLFVAGSFHAHDHWGIVRTLRELGKGFYGVINADRNLTKGLVEELNAGGIRGVRFNVKRLGVGILSELERIALSVWEWAGWHVDLYIENRMLKPYLGLIGNLPAVCIDHMGLTLEGFDDLLLLVEKGVRVKVSGFGRLDFDPRWGLERILEVNADAAMFGTDLPSTRSPKPFSWRDLEAIKGLADRRVLVENALNFLGGGA